MMTIEALSWSTGLTLCVILGALVWLGQRQTRALRLELAELSRRCADQTRANASWHAVTDELRRRVGDIVQRQALLDARPPGGRRIENAIQVARHGAASVDVLRDLGLSDGEAALLMRLHGIAGGAPAKEPPTAPATAPAGRSAQAQNLAAAMAQSAAVAAS